ncbi:uncharacterized protein FA14DRAFT_159754 [Meira miltonrushii]|uniref:Uncharacterized protein n=1 Tax=Meira miltonrushii TaxID=1280837 RepID=A0A316VLL0_9BASI|nr:uncharacterized protein FA14DRAFT_159754 [Meira miltonrushii]PWN37958.1 hypothetical protein FA14DRAFT_159754 [Meira miltonrushii]
MSTFGHYEYGALVSVHKEKTRNRRNEVESRQLKVAGPVAWIIVSMTTMAFMNYNQCSNWPPHWANRFGCLVSNLALGFAGIATAYKVIFSKR